MRMEPSSSFNQQSNHGTMDELGTEAEADVDSISSCSSRVSSVESSDSSDLMDEATSSLSPSPPPSSSSASTASPLHDISTLMNQLPLKRGLSKHFQGKSQSFTSLSNVRCLEDLAKPENPYHKKLKSCKSYGGLSSSLLHRTLSSSRFVPPKASNRVSCSSLGAKRTSGFLGNKPPMPPPRRANRTPLFA